MKAWFCNTAALSSAAKIAASLAGTMVAANNPALVASILPVAAGIQDAIAKGKDPVAVNGIFHEAINELVAHFAGNTLITAEIQEVLSLVNINIALPTVLDNHTITELVTAFLAGCKVASPKSVPTATVVGPDLSLGGNPVTGA